MTQAPAEGSAFDASPTTKRPKDLLDSFGNELFHLNYVWSSFKYLFAAEKNRVDVLNAAAPGVFAMMQRTMFDDVILRINRLTDWASISGKATVSLAQFLKLTDWQQTDRQKWGRFDAELKKVDAACADCHLHRNERIAHRALHGSELPPATMKMIDRAIAAIEAFVSMADEAFGRTLTEFTPLDVERDVERLMRYLLNRPSQKRPDAVSTIRYRHDKHHGFFECAFCGEVTPVVIYIDSTPSPRQGPRRHFSRCTGVVGMETVLINAIEETGALPARQFTLDLKVPEKETE